MASLFSFGFIVRVGHRHFGFHSLLPSAEFGAEFGSLSWVALGQVGSFAGILGQVVQFKIVVMVKLDELPVAITNRGARFPGGTVVVGVMPVKRALAGVVALELGQQAAAVDVQLGLEEVRRGRASWGRNPC